MTSVVIKSAVAHSRDILDELKTKLVALGFKATEWGKDGVLKRKVFLHKELANVDPVCNATDKLYLEVAISEFDGGTFSSHHVEMSIHGDCLDTESVEVKFYALQEDYVLDKLPYLEARLIKAWKAIQP